MLDNSGSPAIRGMKVDISTAGEETPKVQWQTKLLSDTINFIGLKRRGYMIPLDIDAIDVTEEEYSLAKEFSPEIFLKGSKLHSVHKNSFAGKYLRILKEKRNEPEERVIQWIFVWSRVEKELFHYLFFLAGILVLSLGIICTWMFNFLSFEFASIIAIILGIVFIIASASQDTSESSGKWNQKIFAFIGVVPQATLVEMFFVREELHTSILKEEFNSFYYVLDIGSPPLPALMLPYIGTSLIIMAVMFFLFYRSTPFIPKLEKKPLTWIPFYVYLHRVEDSWRIRKIRYEEKNEALTFFDETLKTGGYLRHNSHPILAISKSNLDLEPTTFRPVTFTISVLVWIIIFFASLFFLPNLISLTGLALIPVFTLYYVSLYLIGLYVIFSSWPKKIDFDFDFSDPQFHLTDDRLRLFWNLKYSEFQFKTKIQDPFMDDERFKSFYDDLGEIVFFGILPRMREYEQRDFFQRL